MKSNRIFIVFIVMLLALMVGCSNATTNNDNNINKAENKITSKNPSNESEVKIVVEKQTNEKNKYEIYNEIKDSKKIQDVKELLNNIKFENAIVDMAYPPYYKFHLEDANRKQKSNDSTYSLWISPHKDKIELVVDPYGKYVQLSKEKSQKLFQILTGKNLSEA